MATARIILFSSSAFVKPSNGMSFGVLGVADGAMSIDKGTSSKAAAAPSIDNVASSIDKGALPFDSGTWATDKAAWSDADMIFQMTMVHPQPTMKRCQLAMPETRLEKWDLTYIEDHNRGWMHIVVAKVTRK